MNIVKTCHNHHGDLDYSLDHGPDVGGRSFKSLASAATPIQPLRYHPELVQYFYWTLYLDLLLLQLQSHPGGHMLRPLSAAATTTSLYAAKVAAIGSRSSTFMGDCIDPLPCWSGPLGASCRMR